MATIDVSDGTGASLDPAGSPRGEDGMIQRERWEELRRLHLAGMGIGEIARQLDLDRKTVRRWVRQATWQPYKRAARRDTLLAAHAEYLRTRAPAVEYSARILYQELRQQRGYTGSYDTVKLFVQPLRAVRIQAERALVRFETAPGQQSQIDWGQARVRYRQGVQVRHVFVLTLGFSRRSFYRAYPDERMPEFLDAHEAAFEYFGGRTLEHLYDRPRTVCHGTQDGKRVWNPTFKAFADYWGFEPRVCQPYRAQTKGKVESGVKYFRRNFLPGREFVDDLDFTEQLAEWTTTIADVRIHGTTHERPCDRFVREQPHLVSTTGHASFRLDARHQRIVATDYLVSVATNRYSVPFTLIGQPVEVLRRAGALVIFHRGVPVATHAELPGQHQMRILPEHGPGAIARLSRQRRSTIATSRDGRVAPPDVEVRDPAVYETLVAAEGAS